MNKAEFGEAMRKKLSGMPEKDIEKAIEYYNEMINDRMDEGMSEEDAVAVIGSVDTLAENTLGDTFIGKLVAEKVRSKAKGTLGKVLIILGSPIWLSLLIAFAAVILSVYIVIWSVVAALFACDIALCFSGIAFIAASVFFFYIGKAVPGIFCIGGGIFLIGLSFLFFLLCTLAGQGAVFVGKKLFFAVKRMFIKKSA